MKHPKTGQGKRKAPMDSADGGKAMDGHDSGTFKRNVYPLDTSSAGGEMKTKSLAKSGKTGSAGGYTGEDT